jgi:excinuclease ABC subunit C
MLDFELSEEDISLLSEYLSLIAEHKVTVKIPERGDGRALCDMAHKNAEEAARQYRMEGEREDNNLKRFTELLGLPEIPNRIEAYDISNIGNENIVASMVVSVSGKMKKSEYRLFNIKTTDGADDYASMREVISRRVMHIGDGTLSLGECPDLILLDGGKTHVGVVRALLSEKGIEIPLFGMVKDEFHKTRALTDDKSEISIAKEKNVFAFIYKLQEEVHRYTVGRMRSAKQKTYKKSSLTEIKGIGTVKARLLLSHFKTLGVLKGADREELLSVKGITKTDADMIIKHFSCDPE